MAALPILPFFLLSIFYPFNHATSSHRYDLTVSEVKTHPDGVAKPCSLLYNSQYPGPLITARMGDNLSIHVKNNLSQPTSVHWHGIFQNGTQFQDGPSMVTQCPIQPGRSQVYNFPIRQTGTYWYHAHYESQYTDGLVGPLIIKDPSDPSYYGYTPEAEIIIVLTDWYKWGYKINEMFHNSTGIPPFPHSGLINGRGQFPCVVSQVHELLASMGLQLGEYIVTKHCDTRKQTRSLFHIKPGTVVRIRVINASAMAAFSFSIDSHKLLPIEVDGMSVSKESTGEPVDSAYIAAAQRYSFLVKMDQKIDTYNIRAVMDTEFLAAADILPNLNLNARWTLKPQTTAGLVYSKGKRNPKPKESWEHFTYIDARKVPSNGRINDTEVEELTLLPREGDKAPDKVDVEWELSVGLIAAPAPYPLFNGKQFRLPKENEDPFLMQVVKGKELADDANPLYVGRGQVGQIIVNNYEPFHHPLHLHGNQFWVVGKGKKGDGPYNPELHASSLNITTVKRDTVVVKGQSWVAIRFVGDNPGVWIFHCHLDWHNAAGMAMSVVVDKEGLVGLSIPHEANRVCRQRHLKKDDVESDY